MKKILVALLSLTLIMTMMPLSVFAGTDNAKETNSADQTKISKANYSANEISGSAQSEIPETTQSEKETPMSLTAVGGDVTVGMFENGIGKAPEFSLNYAFSPDAPKEDWKEFNKEGVVVPGGQTIYFKNAIDDGQGHYPGWLEAAATSWSFTMTSMVETATVEANGNIMSLAYPVDFADEDEIEMPGGFFNLFYECALLTKGPLLPAAKLSNKSYAYMFYRCTSLVEAPELPAEDLDKNCYEFMFRFCESLKQAPELNAMELAPACYSHMFDDCSSLINAPKLPATEMVDGCYRGMFSGCTSLEVAPELKSTHLADQCYSGMFGHCKIKEPPLLPATELKPSCYSGMFFKCEKMQYAPVLPAKAMRQSCYNDMFEGCSLIDSLEVHFEYQIGFDYDEGLGRWLQGTKGTIYCPSSWKGHEEELYLDDGWKVSFLKQVTFDLNGGTGTAPETQALVDSEKAKKPSVDETDKMLREGYRFIGLWYTDSACKEPFDFNTKITEDITLYAGWEKALPIPAPEINGFEAWGSDPITANAEWNIAEITSAVYFVYRGTEPTGDWGDAIAKLSFDENKFTQTVEESNVKYYYMVRAAVRDGNGNYLFGPYTNVDYAWPRVIDVNGFYAYAPNASQANIVWEPAKATGVEYWIYRGSEPYGDWGAPITKVTDLSRGLFIDYKAHLGQKNYYLIRAVQQIDGTTYFGEYTKMDYAWPR